MCTALFPQVKEDVLPFSTYDEGTRMFAIDPELCRSRRVVVATCGAAGGAFRAFCLEPLYLCVHT